MPASMSRLSWSTVTSLSRKLDRPPPTNTQLVESVGSAEAVEIPRKLAKIPTARPALAERQTRGQRGALFGCGRVKAGLG